MGAEIGSVDRSNVRRDDKRVGPLRGKRTFAALDRQNREWQAS
jgi:hypothetical protein